MELNTAHLRITLAILVMFFSSIRAAMTHPHPKPRLPICAAIARGLLGALFVTPALAQTQGLSTQPGEEVGISISNYTYEEPGYMDLKAVKLGVEYSITRTFSGAWPRKDETSFFTGEFRFATGDPKYTNISGTTGSDLTDWYWEARALTGADIDMDGYVLAPYVGLGYRHLFNDLRPLTNGYRRESSYFSLPIGFTVRTRASDQSQLLTTFEYMHLLSGTQTAQLKDYNPSGQNLSMKQSEGNGVRLKMIRQFPTWSIGPTLTYWRVGASDTAGSPAYFEPKNNTLELGLSAKKRF